MPVGAFVGASGAVLGVAVAFAYFWPDAELIVFPIPFPIKARTLVIGLVVLDVIASRLWPNDGIAHLAHVGGALFGFIFFEPSGGSPAGARRSRPARSSGWSWCSPVRPSPITTPRSPPCGRAGGSNPIR